MIIRILTLSLSLLLISCGSKSSFKNNSSTQITDSSNLLSRLNNADIQRQDGVLSLPAQEVTEQPEILEYTQNAGLIDLRSDNKKPVKPVHLDTADYKQVLELDSDLKQIFNQVKNKAAKTSYGNQSAQNSQGSPKGFGRIIISEKLLTDERINESTALELLALKQKQASQANTNDNSNNLSPDREDLKSIEETAYLTNPVTAPTNLFKSCNARRTKFLTYDDLTKLAKECQWSLPLIIKLNQLQSDYHFSPQEAVILPTAVFNDEKEQSETDAIQAKEPLDCQSSQGSFDSFEHIKQLSSQCGWRNRYIMILNGLSLRDFTNIKNTKLLLPPVFQTLRRKHQAELESSPTLQEICKRNLYELSNTDNPMILIELCGWDFSLFAIINRIDTSQSPLKIPSQILLPNAVEQARKELNKERQTLDSSSLVSQNHNERIRLCTQIKHSRSDQIRNIIALCGWDNTLIHRLNSQELPVSKKLKKAFFYAPMIMFEKFGKKSRWRWPIDNPNIIEPLSGNKLRLKSVITQKVRSAQSGIVIYKHEHGNGLIDLVIMHEDNFTSVYQNIDQASVKSGYKVEVAEVIGELHPKSDGLVFSLLQSDKSRNALRYLSGEVN